ncbi:MAG: T9SS type A sorting domain-containing protein [Bacteroidetes bacterium]|nr:T9SS type A sorting domain-containing protein [Bacteroidota bacterium]
MPNPSFEQFDTCPDDVAQIQRAQGWFTCGNSPDYFNACDTFWVSVPDNFTGHQYPANGVAYAGLITYSGIPPNVREFMGTQLISPLMIGQKYYVSFQVSFTINKNPDVCIAANKIGAKFSTFSYIVPDVYSPPNPALINNFAHVYADSIIKDTANWVTISGSFIADSTYNYIMVGNFFDDANTDTSTVNLDSVSVSDCHSYYYIDNVCVSTDSLTCSNNVGIKEIEDEFNFLVFPNPATDFIEINSDKNMTEVTIYDFYGRKIIERKSEGKSLLIDIPFLEKGIYFINVNGIWNNKFIKL